MNLDDFFDTNVIFSKKIGIYTIVHKFEPIFSTGKVYELATGKVYELANVRLSHSS